MAKKVKSYRPEFRRKVLELVRSGRSVNAVAHEFEIARQTIMNWLKQDEIDAGRREGVTTEEQLEIRRLKKRVRELEIEREILKKAAAWFARETDSIPNKDSNS
jgi:transposase